MANQKGIIKLKGTMGDITFYKSKDGYMAREKGGIDVKRFRTDPAYARVRENAQEFGHAGKIGALLRRAFRPLTIGVSDARSTSRLVKKLMAVIRTDAVNKRGERLVAEGDLMLLNNFEFNVKTSISQILNSKYTVDWDRATGELKLVFSPFVSKEGVAVPKGATHYRILTGAAAVDFTTETHELSLDQSDIYPWDLTQIPDLELGATLTPNGQNPVFAMMAVVFYQQVNGEHYLLNNGMHNVSSIVLIDKP